jgi:hypothetical protein
MWSARQKSDGEVYLTYDRYRFTRDLRGLWEYLGPKDNTYTAYAVRVNQNAGYLCCADDEGNVRVLVLEE